MLAISLFTGAGGLDIGCEAAGFRTVAAVECDPIARETVWHNAAQFFPALEPGAIYRDVVGLDAQRLLAGVGLRRGEVDLLHGGPPCTPFSKSGYWLEYKRTGSDPKASLLDAYVRVLDDVQPKAFLMENVYGLAYRNHNRPILERFAAGVRRAGYVWDRRVLLAADYGVPQLRQRLLCVGIRRDMLGGSAESWKFSWPRESLSGPHETRKGWDVQLPPHRTAEEAFAGLAAHNNPPEPEETVSGRYADELKAVPAGDNYLFWTAHRGHTSPRFRWRSRYWNFLLKLHPDRPSPTIQGQPGPWVGPFHWENRRLRVAEVKRLMTFPDAFLVLGTRRERQLQLGNAVPPLFARTVAAVIREELVRIESADGLPVAA
jgi:DNA (cytosine-5)-methyltransferase 1